MHVAYLLGALEPIQRRIRSAQPDLCQSRCVGRDIVLACNRLLSTST